MTYESKKKLLLFFNDALPLYEAAAAGQLTKRQINDYYLEKGLCAHLTYWLSKGKMQTGFLVMNKLLDLWLEEYFAFKPSLNKYYLNPCYGFTGNVENSIAPRLEIIRQSIQCLNNELLNGKDLQLNRV